MGDTRKRKAGEDAGARSDKRHKKQWRVPRSNNSAPPPSIQPGDSGIWATCDKGREGKCVGELKDLLTEYAETLYPDTAAQHGSDAAAEDQDIENDILAEINDLHRPKTRQLFTPIRIDVQCGEHASPSLTIPIMQLIGDLQWSSSRLKLPLTPWRW